MRSILFMMITLLFSLTALCQKTNPNFDSTLAKNLGADDYGMKQYVFVILKTGSNTTATKTESDSLFAGHLNNIKRLAELRKLSVAGPFLKNDQQFRGLFILNVSTLEEARSLLDTDPAIRAKLLAPELYPWYGSAALSEYLPAHEKVWRLSF